MANPSSRNSSATPKSSDRNDTPIVRTRAGEEVLDEDRGTGLDNSMGVEAIDDASEITPLNHSLSAGYRMPVSDRRSSFTSVGPMLPISSPTRLPSNSHLTRAERSRAREEEITLLRDNHIIAADHRSSSKSAARQRDGAAASSSQEDRIQILDEEPSEITALLGGISSPNTPRTASIDKQWDEAVIEGKIETTWKREVHVLLRYASPLMLACLMQYSLTLASVLAVGHLGKNELAAVSVATMTSNITAYCAYEGLATCLDTLCAQAYGSGRPHLVGLHLQRMVYFLWLITIPIGVVWLFSPQILVALIPERECAILAGLYLRVLIAGAPGFAAFEAGKRFVQAQGLFNANLYVLLFCAPLNAFMNWFFVWQLKWGFIGAPIAVAISHNLLPLGLWLYVYFIDGRECWNGFTKQAFKNWGPMISLALPGYMMVASEYLAFEILTLASSYISSTTLAAQSVMATLSVITYQVPFPVSIAASTRIANFVGATLSGPAKLCVKVALVLGLFEGLVNVTILSVFRRGIPTLYTDDQEVIDLIVRVIPIFVAFQLFDALSANCNGILRGVGRQVIGGWVNLFSYYAIGMPLAFALAFGLRWGLFGLWLGPAVGLLLSCSFDMWFIFHMDWDRIIEAASKRNDLA